MDETNRRLFLCTLLSSAAEGGPACVSRFTPLNSTRALPHPDWAWPREPRPHPSSPLQIVQSSATALYTYWTGDYSPFNATNVSARSPFDAELQVTMLGLTTSKLEAIWYSTAAPIASEYFLPEIHKCSGGNCHNYTLK